MRSRSIQVTEWGTSGSFHRFCWKRTAQRRTYDLGEVKPVGRLCGQGLVAGEGGSVVLAGGTGLGGDQASAHPSLSLKPGQGGIDGAFEDVSQADLVEPLHQLVAVRLPFGEKLQQEQRQDALEHLGVVARGHITRLCLVLVFVKY